MHDFEAAGRKFALKEQRPFGVTVTPFQKTAVNIAHVVAEDADALVRLVRTHAIAVFQNVDSADVRGRWSEIFPASARNSTHIPHLDGSGAYPALIWTAGSGERLPTGFIQAERLLQLLRDQKHILADLFSQSERSLPFAREIVDFHEQLSTDSTDPIYDLHSLYVRCRNDQILASRSSQASAPLFPVWLHERMRKAFGIPVPTPVFNDRITDVCVRALSSLSNEALKAGRENVYLHDWRTQKNTAAICCNDRLRDGASCNASTFHFGTFEDHQASPGELFRYTFR